MSAMETTTSACTIMARRSEGRTGPGRAGEGAPRGEIVETRIWIREHDWLYGIYTSAENTSPRFGFPDLISACVSLVFDEQESAARIFGYLRSTLVLLDPQTPRRRAELWRAQYELLADLQRGHENRHPNPTYQVDQFTTTCVALVARTEDAKRCILEQARRNTAERAGSH